MNIGVLSGYFDESERPDHSDPIGVAGYLFKPVAYKQFARRWRSDVLSLLPEGALYLHMTDLYAGWDVYHGMSITKRADIFKAAVTVINEHVTAGIGASFYQDEFEASVPAIWPSAFGSNYTNACQICFTLAIQWLKECRPTDAVIYTLEQGHKFENEVDSILRHVAATPGLRKMYHYNTHRFQEKREARGLHAADVLAWCATKTLAIKKGDKMPKPFLDVMNRLAVDQRRYRVKLLTGVALPEMLKAVAGQEVVKVNVGPRKRSFR